MIDRDRSTPSELFVGKYADDPDPWGYETSEYEHKKYRHTLAALPRSRYRSALEIGCSIGVFTAYLASRCDEVLAVDVAEQALQRAKARCSALPNVRFEMAEIPATFPEGKFDLVILSEVGYYWSTQDLIQARDLIVDQLAEGGHLVLVHWTAPIDDAPLTGDIVHETFMDTSDELQHMSGSRERLYRLDVFARHRNATAAS